MAENITNYPETHALCAVKFKRKMRGGSQSSLVEAEDGNYYIVKLMENPQGSEILLNEVLASGIMEFVGLETPKWNPIWISAGFIEDNPGLWFETASSGRRPPPVGLHFGSRLILPKTSESLYEILPRSWFTRIRDKENFVGMLLFDLWANQRDNRQAIFLQDQEDRSIRTTYIDHGCLFGPDESNKIAMRIRAMYMDPAIYGNIDLDVTFPKWEARIRALSESTLRSLISRLPIPSQWYTSEDINRIVSGLAERRALLGKYADLIRATLSSLRVDMLAEQPDEIQICGAQLRADGYRRIRRAVSRVG
jgi:hypothetical protein